MTGDPWREAWAALHGLYAMRLQSPEAHAIAESVPQLRKDAFFDELRDLVTAGRITFDVGALMGWDIGVAEYAGYEPRPTLERTARPLTPDRLMSAPAFDFDRAERELQAIYRTEHGLAAVVAARAYIAVGRARALELYKAGERPTRRVVLLDDPPGVKPA